MKEYKKMIGFLMVICCLSFCASKDGFQTKFPQEFALVYSEHWTGGVRGAGGGIHFYMEFKKPLTSDILLEKVYFQDLEAKVQRKSQTVFEANFTQQYKDPDLISEDDGNQASGIVKPKFELEENQAVLEYKENNKTMFFKINNIKEKPMIAYP